MSLKITNLATDKQKAILQKLEYAGTGQFAIDKLSITDAAELITELFEQERLARAEEQAEGESYADYYNNKSDDPFKKEG